MNNKRNEIENKYKRKNSLIRFKLLEYIPILVISNLSTLLILSVDSIVVGNYVGSEALAAIQIFYPANVLLGVFSAIISNGTAQSLSEGLVKHDFENLKYIKAAIRKVVFIAFFVVAIIQIPIVLIILKSYHLDPSLYEMTRNYAIGIMIAMPFSIISAVSVCQLQMVGRVKTLMWFAIIEGTLNLILDLFFVGKLGLGVVGAGLGSGTACIIRSMLTLYYLYKKTDIHKNTDVKVRIEDVISIIKNGLPEASSILVNAFQSYVIMKILLVAFTGSSGGTIKSVCAFCSSLVTVAVSSLQGGIRPIFSIMAGSNDKNGLYNSMRIAIRNILVSVGIITIIMQIKPEIFYHLHGVKEIPEYGILSLRLYTMFFIYNGLNTIFRSYFVCRNDANFSTKLTLIGNLAMPLFAYALYKLCSPPYIWLCNTFTAVLILIVNIMRYISFIKKDKSTSNQNEEILYLTVPSEKAIEASKDIEDYIISEGYPRDLANDMGMCMEEMVYYTIKSQNRFKVNIQIIVNVLKDSAKFVMLDDGQCIKLNENNNQHELELNNYDIIKKLAKSYDYQYILNMNYTTLNFEHNTH